MSCDRLGELSLETAIKLGADDPDRTDLLQLPARFHCECPATRQTHTSKAVYGEKPPLDPGGIPDFLRKVPKAKELFARHHVLEEIII